MSVFQRNYVRVAGTGPRTMAFAHGFGCDQNMWRLLAPVYQDRYRTLLFDHVGSGSSDLRAYDPKKYNSLRGYAEDVIAILEEADAGPVVFVGHSVSAMIGLLANIERPDLFAAQIMVGPSPCYIDDGDYRGGFERKDIEALLDTLDGNYLGWSSNMAPAIMGAPEHPDLSVELTNSFCRTDPEVAKQFARVTFMADVRSEVPKLAQPALVLQCTDDIIAPVTVGEYLKRTLPRGSLALIENVGHCPHLSAPGASAAAIDAFLRDEGL